MSNATTRDWTLPYRIAADVADARLPDAPVHPLGLSTRAVGGYDRELARTLLGTPDSIELHAVIALGYRADAGSLPESLREREKPNGRRPASAALLPVPTQPIG